jgi:uncharacterized protein YciI
MALFSFYGKDGPQGPQRRNEHREGHLENIASMDQAGRIVFAGPLKNEAGASIGALIIFDAADLDAALKWVEADPYVKGGVFETIEVLPVVKAYPKS